MRQVMLTIAALAVSAPLAAAAFTVDAEIPAGTWRWSDFEIPFANARRMTLMPPQFRLFGRDIALALKAYLEPFK